MIVRCLKYQLVGVLMMTLSPITWAQGGRPASVVTAIVEKRALAPTIWVPGTVISRQDSKIASEVSGVLKQVLEVGDSVKKGDILAQVDDRKLQLQYSRDRADLARLETRRVFAKKQLERTQSLSASNSTAEFRIDELQMEHDVIQQEIALAKAKIKETIYLIERSKILAPFTGVVANRAHVVGEYIGIGEQLLRLVNTSNLEISAKAPVEVNNHISAGQKITVKTNHGNTTSSIRSIIPVGDPISRMLEVRATLTGDWVIGDAVSIALNKGPQVSSVIVPRDALILRGS